MAKRRPGRHDDREQRAVDAYLELVLSGSTDPTLEVVAERAGVTAASLHRSFGGTSDLLAPVAEHVAQQVTPAMSTAESEHSDTEARVASFVARRLDTHEQFRTLTAAARHHLESPGVRRALAEAERAIRTQLVVTFDPELRDLDTSAHDRTIVAMQLPLLFDSLEAAYRLLGNDRSRVADTLCHALNSIIINR